MSSQNAEQSGTIVVDIGKKKSKLVKALRKGEGRLMEQAHELVAQMRADGQIASGADTVVVVVEKKPKKVMSFPL